MMDTDKNAFLKEHGCCFYLSNDGKTQLCAVDSEQWKQMSLRENVPTGKFGQR